MRKIIGIMLTAIILAFFCTIILTPAIAEDKKHIIVKIYIDGTVEVFSPDEKKQLTAKPTKSREPLPVNKPVKHIDRGTWYVTNPLICFWWDAQLVCY